MSNGRGGAAREDPPCDSPHRIERGNEMARILVADDASFMRQMIREIVEAEGFEVCGEASDGIEAVEQYKEMVAHLDHQKNILVPEARELRRFAEKASEVPESERTPQQVAIIKTHEDYCHWRDTDYDYDDEYDDFDMPIEILP